MAIKEGDKFPMDSTFQIKGDAGPAVREKSAELFDILPRSPAPSSSRRSQFGRFCYCITLVIGGRK